MPKEFFIYKTLLTVRRENSYIIETLLKLITAMVVCISEPYLQSKPCQLELEYGFKKDLPLIGKKLTIQRILCEFKT